MSQRKMAGGRADIDDIPPPRASIPGIIAFETRIIPVMFVSTMLTNASVSQSSKRSRPPPSWPALLTRTAMSRQTSDKLSSSAQVASGSVMLRWNALPKRTAIASSLAEFWPAPITLQPRASSASINVAPVTIAIAPSVNPECLVMPIPSIV
jgi:hypothetical protein